jgi:hypothetical protein
LNGTTNTKGEYRFSEVEYSFAGLTAKVIVKKNGYEEKWSDITSDLMTGKDNPERQFLVYIKKTCTMVGTWVQETEGGIPTTSWTITADGKAREVGGGNATGTATFTGRKLHIEWTTRDGYAGYYEWNLDEDCTSGKGNLVFTKTGVGTHKSNVKRR